ncbi:MAG TPA: hypothetical protein VK563_18415 [Puia sp.]|nr:hypothetical protein [Puia sp.]
MIIRRFSAGLLLLLFLLGNTPKKTLHDLFAHHKDLSGRSGGEASKAQVGNKGFSCNCESQVVESPFTQVITHLELIVPSVNRPEKFSTIGNAWHRLPSSYAGLRGPPIA